MCTLFDDSYCNLFFIRDVHGEFGLIDVHLFDILPAILSGKVIEKLGIFYVWRVVTLIMGCGVQGQKPS